MSTIKTLRAYLGLKQTEFAKKLDVSEQTIVNWERSKTVPTKAMYALIAQIFNASFHWLLTGEGEMFGNPSAPSADLSPLASTINDWLSTLDADEQSWVKVELMRKFPEFKDFVDKQKI